MSNLSPDLQTLKLLSKKQSDSRQQGRNPMTEESYFVNKLISDLTPIVYDSFYLWASEHFNNIN